MRQEDALRGILSEWHRLPEQERQTEGQLAAFAMKMANDLNFEFPYPGDRYQRIMGYLNNRVSGLKKDIPR